MAFVNKLPRSEYRVRRELRILVGRRKHKEGWVSLRSVLNDSRNASWGVGIDRADVWIVLDQRSHVAA
jgi:hypothetical protein